VVAAFFKNFLPCASSHSRSSVAGRRITRATPLTVSPSRRMTRAHKEFNREYGVGTSLLCCMSRATPFEYVRTRHGAHIFLIEPDGTGENHLHGLTKVMLEKLAGELSQAGRWGRGCATLRWFAHVKRYAGSFRPE